MKIRDLLLLDDQLSAFAFVDIYRDTPHCRPNKFSVRPNRLAQLGLLPQLLYAVDHLARGPLAQGAPARQIALPRHCPSVSHAAPQTRKL